MELVFAAGLEAVVAGAVVVVVVDMAGLEAGAVFGAAVGLCA
jgi:hypothetical protein